MLQYIVNQDVSNSDNFKRTDHGICMVSVELYFEQPVSFTLSRDVFLNSQILPHEVVYSRVIWNTHTGRKKI